MEDKPVHMLLLTDVLLRGINPSVIVLATRVNFFNTKYDTKQSDGNVPVMMKFWGMWSTPLLPLLPGPPWTGLEWLHLIGSYLWVK